MSGLNKLRFWDQYFWPSLILLRISFFAFIADMFWWKWKRTSLDSLIRSAARWWHPRQGDDSNRTAYCCIYTQHVRGTDRLHSAAAAAEVAHVNTHKWSLLRWCITHIFATVISIFFIQDYICLFISKLARSVIL